MFDYLYEWLRNLAFYMILMTAVLQVIPNSTYQKYIHFFAGLILVILLAAPILKLFGVQQEFSHIYKSAQYRQEIEDIQEASSFLEQVEQPLFEEGGQ